MKNIKQRSHGFFVALALLACSTLDSHLSTLFAQTTAFTYQGRLNNGTNPANGSYDMTFALYTASSGGLQIGNTLTNLGVGVTNGLFVVTNDFGAVYGGSAEWLQIEVRTNGGGSFSPLSPLQELTPTPYAVYAESAGSTTLVSDPGTQNLFAGQSAGNQTLTGSHNTGVGFGVLGVTTTGVYNTGIGVNSLLNNTTGGNNTTEGVYALWKNTTGGNNTAIGADVMAYNQTGNFNTAMGAGALENATTGSNNVAIGSYAMASATDSDLVAVGYGALQNENAGGFLPGGNTAVGYVALQADTTGFWNTAVGFSAMGLNVSGSENTAMGFEALGSTSGDNNAAFGFNALSANTTGSDNVAVGSSALAASTGSGNTAIGGSTLAANVGGYNNTVMGYEAIEADTASIDNVAIGVADLYALTSGNENTAVGTYALENMTSGTGNVGLGYSAGNNLTTGNNNIYIGNSGGSSESGVTLIGTAGTQTASYISGTLEVSGEYIAVDGLTPLRCYLGDDGAGNDVQVGSLTHGITAVSLYNQADNSYMNLFCSNITSKASTCTTITITGGSDLAEPFEISNPSREIPDGSVVVIDEENPGHLKLSNRPYDTRVAGVLSGANGIHAGIQMQQQGLLEGGKNVALTGRVYVQADASNGTIKPGDLLTTSSTPGRAMRVSNHTKAQGAILGKAMTGLNQGQGMVLVLVTLQ